MARNSYIYRVLARLAYLHVTSKDISTPATTQSLYEWLLGGQAMTEKNASNRYMPADEHGLERALRDLERLGVIRGDAVFPDDSDEVANDNVVWRFSGAVPPDYELAKKDGGDVSNNEGGEPPPNLNVPGGGDGDGGGAGLGQVLAHPVLFSIDESEWDAVVDSAFARVASGPEPDSN